ncbi:MAG TPA: lysylphosphatidylglycerol synthase transmembrane domain-containing protein, partial [Terriglobales bacterium]|nr:lysylphosphatidylglycerol synthase transmembrane domain-containing protein [Terriglobales bacterium]
EPPRSSSRVMSPSSENPRVTAALVVAWAIAAAAAVALSLRAWRGDLGIVAALLLAATAASFLYGRRIAPKRLRGKADGIAKAALTGLGGMALLRHPITAGDGTSLPVYAAIATHVRNVDPVTFATFAMLAVVVKLSGVIASAFGWHLLLIGQGIRFPFWSMIATSFLIGRFIGTFLPSTLGLDGYTLYEASRYSNQWTRAVTAKAVEKLIGIAGLFAGMVLTLPFGYPVLHDVAAKLGRPTAAPLLAAAIVAIAGGVTVAVLIGVVRPGWLQWLLRATRRIIPGMLAGRAEEVLGAVEAYRGRPRLLLAALLAKFVTHFSTAVVYYCTALAIGVVAPQFWPIVFGSTIQILATLVSPTIAGEGAREAFQALLLSQQLGGVAQAVLSAALGFIAAEAATLWGGVFLWSRTPTWRPGYAKVDDHQVTYSWLKET